MGILADPLFSIVEDAKIHVLLRLEEDLFGILLVFEAEFVEAAAADGGAGLERAHRLVVGERVGRHHVGVVDAADADGLIGIALFKGDDDFLADTGDGDEPEVLAGPRHGATDPAGAGAVVLGGAIPEELDLDAAVFIGIDLLTGGTDDNGGLRAVDDRFGRDALGAIGEREGDAGEDGFRRGAVVVVAGFVAAALGDGEADACDEVGVVVLVVAFEVKLVAGEDAEIGGVAGGGDGVDGLLLHADLGGALVVFEDLLQLTGLFAAAGGDAVEAFGVAAGVVVEFEGVVAADLEFVGDIADLERLGDQVLGLEILVRQFEGVVPEGCLAGAEGLCLFPGVDDLGFVDAAGVGVVVERGGVGEGDVGLGGIAKDDGMAVLGVAEVVEDSFLFHEAGEEIKVAFAVLDAVVARFVGDLGFPERGDVADDCFEDIGDGFLLKDAALGDAGEDPELGNELEAVAGVEIAAGAAGDRLDDAVEGAGELAGVAVDHIDANAGWLADEAGEIDHFLVGGEGINAKAEEL